MPTFLNPDGSFLNEEGGQPTTVFTPLTGATITIPSTVREVFINPAGTIAALTINLPRAPERDMGLDVGVGQNITSITWKDGLGNTLSGLHSGASAGTAMMLAYVPSSAAPGNPQYKWVKWR